MSKTVTNSGFWGTLARSERWHWPVRKVVLKYENIKLEKKGVLGRPVLNTGRCKRNEVTWQSHCQSRNTQP